MHPSSFSPRGEKSGDVARLPLSMNDEPVRRIRSLTRMFLRSYLGLGFSVSPVPDAEIPRSVTWTGRPQSHPSLFGPSQEVSVLRLWQAEIPVQLIFPGIFATVIYLLAGLPLEAKPFLLFVAFILLNSNAAVSLG